MPEIRIHMRESVTGSYDRGTFRSLKSLARVIYDQTELTNADIRGPRILNDAITKLADQGHKIFTTFKDDDTPTATTDYRSADLTAPVGNPNCPFSNLVLVKLDPKVTKNNNVVDVDLYYEHVMDGHNQLLFNPPSNRLFGRAKASVVEKPTNFYYPFGRTFEKQQQIQVAHTFETLETGIPNAPFDPDLPRTVVIGGEINLPFPGQNYTIQGVMICNDIGKVADDLVGSVNEEEMLGGATRTWLCSEMTWELISANGIVGYAGKGAWKVGLEFQYDSDTWDRTVVFNDTRSHQPPGKLAAAEWPDEFGVKRLAKNPINNKLQPAGYWDVPALSELDFSNYFGGVTFELVGKTP